ncbi:histidinol-phosphatase [Nakamurella lactea]|uniref:histidinol-phosphatase n=1 Tax=Nakamurella lactea TaxID=459515 RepID=UPI000421F0B7|nr:histidinol-phosphatase [Nakamurella lactea]
MTTDADDLALALRLADTADAISLPRFGATDLRVDSKPDLTPVSDADLAVERAIRELLAEQRPADSVLGEEFGDSLPGAERRWVIDPIDGTKNFVRGVPVWATLIALMDGPDLVVGVVSAPALARRWWARSGGGAFSSFNGAPARPIRVSGVTNLSDASLSYSDYAEWAVAPEQARGFRTLLDHCWRTRAYGDFYSYVLVAEGAVDVAAEPELSLWDLAALVPIVTEAGGQATDVSGEPLTAASTSLAVSNGPLHPAVIETLNTIPA